MVSSGVVYVGLKREFPGSPVVRTHSFAAEGLDSIPGQGSKSPQATGCGQKKKNHWDHPPLPSHFADEKTEAQMQHSGPDSSGLPLSHDTLSLLSPQALSPSHVSSPLTLELQTQPPRAAVDPGGLRTQTSPSWRMSRHVSDC